MIEMGQTEPTMVEKRKGDERKHLTNCYDCEVSLSTNDIKINDESGDKRIFCKLHYKKRFGKKKKLKKRY